MYHDNSKLRSHHDSVQLSVPLLRLRHLANSPQAGFSEAHKTTASDHCCHNHSPAATTDDISHAPATADENKTTQFQDDSRISRTNTTTGVEEAPAETMVDNNDVKKNNLNLEIDAEAAASGS
jgi:hypothetical protein